MVNHKMTSSSFSGKNWVDIFLELCVLKFRDSNRCRGRERERQREAERRGREREREGERIDRHRPPWTRSRSKDFPLGQLVLCYSGESCPKLSTKS